MYKQCIAIIAIFITFLLGTIFADNSTDELAKLRERAENQAKQESNDDNLGKDTFTSGALALQSLNPELSVTGDFLWSSGNNDIDSDFFFRGLALHLQAYLDPYTKFKAAVSFNEDETEFEEGYFTRFSIIKNVNFTAGKFRQQFGVVNRWHKHAIDQVDFPLALREIFGDGGLNQTGISIDWTIPQVLGFAQALTIQVTDADNERLFGENADNKPAYLAHYKIFRDITSSTYLELGLTGLMGENNEWTIDDTIREKSLSTYVGGVDFTLLWEPVDRMRYKNITWRSEAYFLNKDILAPDGSGDDTISSWGVYSYLQSKITRTLYIGVRGDYYVPDSKSYATKDSDLSPLATDSDDPYMWQISPYITWFQSPFVHFRVEYDHSDGSGIGEKNDVVWLQCIFAGGPHKHERY